ncbi:hypothetical protein Htur_1673 [Haloterrigena turkmenica DSM 5511]|uniref:Uncharacterized protein n=1 Tax=Haloterrigena turkmenica (strain ATCC 51198 / DSM 5511 / JCM 9101 / NCIMB 13204 / VKM B-1734 / 4k) TaxID=543526 RepID=D2RRJ8_HALTV|nr:hypothetical protein [Haloterrigena turkmenica]ADB60558.1 hypothetical protein Htur_1673 [Haloterrigena turkmenica DSM 5511]
MTDRSRRTILCGTAGLFALTAGCLDEMDVASENGDPDDDPEGATGDDDPDDGTEPSSIETYDTVSYTRNEAVDPTGELFVDAGGADSWLIERGLDEEQYVDFVDDTLFDDSILLALEAEAPQLNYELELETVALDAPADQGGDDETEDGEEAHGASLAIKAVVTEAADGEESNDVGGTQVISVGKLVRVTFDGEPVTTAAASIVDHHGDSHGFTMTVERSSESAPEPDEDA